MGFFAVAFFLAFLSIGEGAKENVASGSTPIVATE